VPAFHYIAVIAINKENINVYYTVVQSFVFTIIQCERGTSNVAVFQ